MRASGKPGQAGQNEIVLTVFTPTSQVSFPRKRESTEETPAEIGHLQNVQGVEGEGGDGGEKGTSEILRKIRAQIEREKYYPLLASRKKMEGKPLLEFSIRPDGTVENLRLRKSSGFDLLDKAALHAVTQAAPLPYYPESIQLEMTYHIR